MRCLWVGLAHKRSKNGVTMAAFDVRTPSGALVHRIAEGIPNATHLFDNIVSYVPTDTEGKERLPNKVDFEASWKDFWCRVEASSPDLLVIFGGSAAKFCQKRLNLGSEKYSVVEYNGVSIAFCDHPSYVNIYKRKSMDTYIEMVRALQSQAVAHN